MVFSDFEIIDNTSTSTSSDELIMGSSSDQEYEYTLLKRDGSCPDLKRVAENPFITRKKSCPEGVFNTPIETWAAEQEKLLANWVSEESAEEYVSETESYWNYEPKELWVSNWEETEQWWEPTKKNDNIHFQHTITPEPIKDGNSETICDKIHKFFLDLYNKVSDFFSDLFW